MVNQERGFIQNVILIAAILGIVFLSQSPAARPAVQSFYKAQIGPYVVKANDWFSAAVYPKVSGEVSQKGEALQQAAVVQKNNFVESLWESCRNYFAAQFSKTFGTQVK